MLWCQKKKGGGKRSRKEITDDHEGCFLDGCLTDYVAFEIAQEAILIRTLVADCNHEITVNAEDYDGKKGKKKEQKDDDMYWTICVFLSHE